MAKSKSQRPTAVRRHVNSLRLPADLPQQIDRWAKAMGEDSHSEGMRHLLEIGLSAADRSAPMPIALFPKATSVAWPSRSPGLILLQMSGRTA
jgi:hypothetical protein